MKTVTKSVPLGLHEDVITRHFARDASGTIVEDAALVDLRDAMAFGRLTAEKIVSAHRDIMANEMATSIANEKRARDHGFRLLTAATTKIDAATERAHSEIQAIKLTISGNKAPKNYAEAMMAEEIRSALARMPAESRKAALVDAIESDAEDVITSALSAPALVTGMSANELAILRHQWQRRRYAPEVGRLERLEKALADVSRAGAALLSFVSSMTDAGRIKAAERAQSAAEIHAG